MSNDVEAYTNYLQLTRQDLLGDLDDFCSCTLPFGLSVRTTIEIIVGPVCHAGLRPRSPGSLGRRLPALRVDSLNIHYFGEGALVVPRCLDFDEQPGNVVLRVGGCSRLHRLRLVPRDHAPICRFPRRPGVMVAYLLSLTAE
jgi:hypothetical protein